MIYLDNAATTGWKPKGVIMAMQESMTELCVNAGRGSYELARKASIALDQCRTDVLDLADVRRGYHVYFTPSATIAFNELILGIECDSWTNIYVSPFEHNAVMRPLHAMSKRTGCAIRQIPFERDSWSIDMDRMESAFIDNRPDYVFVSMVSNTTGYRLPLERIIPAAKAYGAKVIVDCAQAFASVEADYAALMADAYVFAGHKTLYGPYGAAGMILADDWPYQSGIYGGTGTDSLSLDMPSAEASGWEPGSLNVPAICGLAAAIKWVKETGPSAIAKHELSLTNLLVDGLEKLPGLVMYVPPCSFRTSMAAFNIEGYQSREVGDILSEEFDIAVRTGYQCAPLVHEWLGTKRFDGIVRVSFGWFNTKDDVNALIEAVQSLV